MDEGHQRINEIADRANVWKDRAGRVYSLLKRIQSHLPRVIQHNSFLWIAILVAFSRLSHTFVWWLYIPLLVLQAPFMILGLYAIICDAIADHIFAKTASVEYDGDPEMQDRVRIMTLYGHDPVHSPPAQQT